MPQAIAPALPSRVALVIEDDDMAADLIMLLLEADGFMVVRAASAEAALLLTQRHDLSLITLDLQLPGMDGWEFLARIRQTDRLADVPVLVISAKGDASMAVGRGATLVLQKPIGRAQLKASMAGLGIGPAQGRACTVLVVDDDPKAIEVIAAFLPSPAYAVVRATGGNEAIDLARRLLPDLILLDLMMPEVSGFDVVEALQASPDTAGIPVLVVTARHVTAMDRAALNCHAGQRLQIMEKAGFNSQRFAAEVRRALQPA
ncbi:MAG: response regulator [Pseudomonadota bacterium]